MTNVTLRWTTCAVLLFGLLGCRTPQESVITGIVSTTSNLDRSVLLTGLDRDPNYKAIEGATIFLSTDEDGKTALEGYKTQSDGEGNYCIRVTPLLSPSTPGRTYYLVVEKHGFQRLVRWITLGPYSSDRKNTALLKPDPDP